MNVTDSIARDLWVLVQAGDASPDTRALLEEYLASHPSLAAELARAEVRPTAVLGRVAPPDAEREALHRTRSLLARRSWSMAAGIFFSALPLACAGDSHGLQFLMLRDQPVIASVSLAIGVAAWISFLHASRSLKPTGF